MAVKVKLEKDGFKKDAYVGFSWTTLFLGIWVPSFRLDLKGFLVFLGIMLFQTATFLFVIINALKTWEFYILGAFSFLFFGLNYIISFLLAIYYNKIYTKNMLLDGWKPMDNDEYSLAILAKYGFIEYQIDAQDEEKIARCKEYIADVKSEERRKWIIFIVPLIFFISTIILMIFGIGLVVLSMLKI
ncbi:hypothetical protein [Fusobacterium periodonticum]|uniref:HrgC protein n=1 Tax=Fusobacterium periodonticum D10 TaxID=620833 RepID=K1GJN7_9FUSO|nr:hypothetical protein [Fusobacterium periodonticum]EKA94249.1 hypothetical protein FPOG_02136 [Fusobacterium periodonticum D10]